MSFKFPNLFIPGAAKSGTTSLHDYLNLHPDIYMTKVKEPHFFVYPEKYFRSSLEKYEDLFKQGQNHKYRGESSTGYMLFSPFIPRIKQKIPAAKFIFLLRNPIDRIYSHYWWLYGKGEEDRSFMKAIHSNLDQEPIFDARIANHKYYYQSGLYGKHLTQFYDSFPRENILIITTCELQTTPQETINKCFSFLNLSAVPLGKLVFTNNQTVVFKHPKFYAFSEQMFAKLSPVKKFVERLANKDLSFHIQKTFNKILKKQKFGQSSYPKMTHEERIVLRDMYRKDIELLKQVTGQQFSEWKDFM